MIPSEVWGIYETGFRDIEGLFPGSARAHDTLAMRRLWQFHIDSFGYDDHRAALPCLWRRSCRILRRIAEHVCVASRRVTFVYR